MTDGATRTTVPTRESMWDLRVTIGMIISIIGAFAFVFVSDLPTEMVRLVALSAILGAVVTVTGIWLAVEYRYWTGGNDD
jgi:uncharacterized membrane protein HdeD (DUF308 family)